MAFSVLISAGVAPLGCVGVNVDRAARPSGGTSSTDDADAPGSYGATSGASSKTSKGAAGSTSRAGASAGTAARAASAAAGNVGSIVATGGSVATGGTQATALAGASAGGSTAATAGMPATGGKCNSAGNSSAVAGAPSSGGAAGTGGIAATAGTANSAGSAGVAGSSYIDNPDVCDDQSTVRASMDNQYGHAVLNTTNNPNKSYIAITNWWNKFTDQTMLLDGLGFSVTNTADAGSGAAPVGFPALYIGDYQGIASNGSNLPLQVSKIRSIPTVFETNATSLDTSNFDAIYDVWFTSSSAPLSRNASSPGASGVMLSIWLYKPSNRQPRGMRTAPTHLVPGVGGAWDVWLDSSTAGTSPTVAYVSTQPQSTLAFDLNKFIDDAVSNHYGVTQSMYLSVVFGGFEIWSGANSAQLKRFCVKVNL